MSSGAVRVWDAVREPRNESERVLALPRRESFDDAAALAYCASMWPGVSMPPRPVQARALYELHLYGRLVGVIGVGHGKTLVMYLAPLVVGARKAVFMMPPTLVASFEREVAKYKAAGYPDVPYTIVPYSALSQPNASLMLRNIAPDLIVADEAHHMRNRNATRTRRFMDYMLHAQDTLFVPMTGTFMEASIGDAAHLFGLALREHSPLPAFGTHLAIWSACLDADGDMQGVSASEQTYFRAVARQLGDEHNPRSAVYKHMRETPGVIMTTTGAVDDIPLYIQPVRLPVPAACRALVQQISETKASPDGSVVYESQAHMSMAIRHALNGFWLRWDWDAVGGRDEQWIEAKRAWAYACRNELEQRSAPGYDSPALVLEATLRRADVRSPLYRAAYDWWQVMDRPEPPRIAVWVDDYLVQWALAQDGDPILWYQSDAMGAALAARGCEVFGAGTDITGGRRRIAAAVRVHGTGTQLQAWDKACVLEPPLGAAAWEQLLGRMHRPGQLSPHVHVDVCTHAVSLDTPQTRAEFQRELKGQQQKLLDAIWLAPREQ